MSLRPLQGKVSPRNMAVYDLEWIPGNVQKAKRFGFEPLELRLIGAFDGRRYVHFGDVRAFLNWACTHDKRGTWYYAHAGGLYDLTFILHYLVDNLRPGVTIQCAMSGSSAIIVKVTRGNCSWYFVDSFRLLPQKLRDIGKWVGLDKGGSQESTDHFYGPLPELIEYNERDCRILYGAIRIFEASINKIGGQLQKTLASTALDVFRRVFLKETIATDDTVNQAARIAYCASRVEVFETDCRYADYYDVNSSFPYAMTFPAPGNLSRIGRSWKRKDIALVKATINVPETILIPPAPYRHHDDGRVYFPVGRWQSWFSSIDLEFLESCGGSIEKVEEAKVFEPFNALKDYAETIYDWRKEAESEALKIVLKFLLNSLYGKFGEGSQKQKVLINPSKDFFKIPEREPGGLGREMLMPGVHALVEDKVIAHAHVPISVHITAIARRVLGEYLRQSPRVYYCDTDGFAVPHTWSYPTSNKLGGLKLEKHVYEAKFLAPKLYAYRKDEDQNWTVRGKGFSRILDQKTGETHSLNYEDFKFLIEHKDLHLEQFARLRTLWRSGDTKPRELELTKTWRGVVRTKRRMLEEGGSVPWHIKELQR